SLFEGVKLRYKVIGREIEWRDSYDCEGDTADGDRITKLISAAKKYGLPTTMTQDYLSTVASENSFNPVEAFIMRQPWDQKTDYIEQLLSTLTIAKGFDVALARTYLKKWLVSAVMLATAPRPQEAHGVFILQSDNHGAGKGRWFKRLVETIDPDLLASGGIDVRDKDSILKIGKKWIYELSEIEASMSRREIGELKAFITTDTDEVRAHYARTAQKLPRRTAFCGSANNKQFLSDPTGSRRFWVIPVERVDYQHSVNIQQVWAQAFHLYQSGESWWLSHDEIQAVTDANNAHFQQLCPIVEGLAGAFKWESDQREWTNYLLSPPK
ncbi:MAG: virulence-associated E family protein, partial [Gammaproteobacteria bacterium]|nr:virulence-associated E family protein [Gammaproteobacteria bacterium]